MREKFSQRSQEYSDGPVVAVDVGTSSLKAGVVSPQGELLEYRRVPFELAQSKPLETEAVDVWLRAMKTAFGSFRRISSVSAVALSGNGPTIVPVGRDGRVLDEASLWLNRRESRLAGAHSFFLPKIAWIKERRREVYDRTEHFLGCPEYLSYYLTGEAAAFSPSAEFDRYIWDSQGIETYQVDRRKLPPIIRSGRVLGEVLPGAALVTGLPRGLPVVATGADFLMSLVGTGVVRPGLTCDRAGTSEGINFCSDRKIQHERLRCLPHAIEGLYNICLLYTSPSPRDRTRSRMPSSA